MTLKPIRTFNVVPTLPPALEGAARTGPQPALVLEPRRRSSSFSASIPNGWQTTHHNPVLLLGTVEQARLKPPPSTRAFWRICAWCCDDFAHYLSDSHDWFAATHGSADGPLVAYFSAEFGLTECLPIFAGGLGLLAGDHLKSASDLGVPLVGVGLLYQQGYFRQHLNDVRLAAASTMSTTTSTTCR